MTAASILRADKLRLYDLVRQRTADLEESGALAGRQMNAVASSVARVENR